MLTKDLNKIEDLVNAFSKGDWELDIDNKTISMGSEIKIQYDIISGHPSQVSVNLDGLVKSPNILSDLLSEVDSQSKSVRYWKEKSERSSEDARGTKLSTIKSCIRLLKSIYIPTKSALGVMREAQKRLELFKDRPIEDLVNQMDGVLVFDEEPPKIP